MVNAEGPVERKVHPCCTCISSSENSINQFIYYIQQALHLPKSGVILTLVSRFSIFEFRVRNLYPLCSITLFALNLPLKFKIKMHCHKDMFENTNKNYVAIKS